jgi:hypothetical protein
MLTLMLCGVTIVPECIFFKLIIIYIQDSYTGMKGKRETSCAANPFWMTKLILLKTTSLNVSFSS